MSCNTVSIRARGFGLIVKMVDCQNKDNSFDVSGASSVTAKFTQGTTEITAVMTNLTDGKDGKMVFVTPTSSQYFPSIGRWNAELTPVFPDGGVYPTTKAAFIVTA